METSHSSNEEHLAPDLLSGYHLGELQEEEATKVRAHLLKCRECAELLFDFQELMEHEAGPLIGNQEPEPLTGKIVSFEKKEVPAGTFRPLLRILPIAVSVAVVIGAASLFLQLSTMPSIWLEPPMRGSSSSIQTVDLSHGAARLLLPVSIDGPLEIRILSSAGATISTRFKVYPPPVDPKRVELVIGDLPTGTYRVIVLRSDLQENSTQGALEEFSFRVID